MKWGIGLAIGFVGYQILRFAGAPFETFLAVLVAIVIGWPIGWFIGTLIRSETDVDTGLFKAIGWLNLVAWLVPIAGIAVAKLTSSVGKESITSRFFYDSMSIAGYALAVLNVSLFAYFAELDSVADRPEFAGAPPFSDFPKSSERSFARCPYAAIEQWTQEEVTVNCRKEPSEEEMRAFELEQQRSLQLQG